MGNGNDYISKHVSNIVIVLMRCFFTSTVSSSQVVCYVWTEEETESLLQVIKKKNRPILDKKNNKIKPKVTKNCILMVILQRNVNKISALSVQEVGSGSTSQKSDEEDFVKVEDLPLQLTVMCEVNRRRSHRRLGVKEPPLVGESLTMRLHCLVAPGGAAEENRGGAAE